MIVCSCSLITAKDVAEAVASIRTADPLVVLTPGLIYRHLGKRPSCGRMPAAHHQIDGRLR